MCAANTFQDLHQIGLVRHSRQLQQLLIESKQLKHLSEVHADNYRLAAKPTLPLQSFNSTEARIFDRFDANKFNWTCSTYHHLRLVSFPDLADNIVQILLGVNAFWNFSSFCEFSGKVLQAPPTLSKIYSVGQSFIRWNENIIYRSQICSRLTSLV